MRTWRNALVRLAPSKAQAQQAMVQPARNLFSSHNQALNNKSVFKFSTTNDLLQHQPPQQAINIPQNLFERDHDSHQHTQQLHQEEGQFFGTIEQLVNDKKLDKAEKLLNFALERNQHVRGKVFGIMIKAFAESNQIEKANHLFQSQSTKKNFAFTARNIAPLIKAYAVRKQVTEARRVFQYLIDHKRNLDMPAVNCTLLAYCKAGQMEDALSFLKSLAPLAVKPDVASVTILVQGYLDLDLIEEATQLIKQMKDEHNIKYTPAVFNTLIKYHLRNNNIPKIQEVVNKTMPENLVEPDDYTISEIINDMIKRNMIEKADEILKEYAPRAKDTTPFNTLIMGYMNLADFEHAALVMELMRSCYLEPDSVTYRILLKGYIQHSHLQEAEDFLEFSIPKHAKQVNFYNIILNGYSKLKPLPKIEEYFEKMKQMDMVDSVSYNTMLSYYVSNKYDKRASLLSKEMRTRGIYEDVTLAIMMKNYIHNNEVEKAQQVYNVVTKYSMPTLASNSSSSNSSQKDSSKTVSNFLENTAANSVSNSSSIGGSSSLSASQIAAERKLTQILQAYLKRDDLASATRIFDEHVSTFGTIGASVFNVFLKYHGEKDDVESLTACFNKMQKLKVKPDAFTYGILLHILAMNGKAEEAEQKLSLLPSRGLTITPAHIGSIVKGYIAAGEIRKAVQFFEISRNKYNVPLTVFVYNTLLKGLMHDMETVEIAEQILQKMQKEKVIGDAYTINIVLRGYLRFQMFEKAAVFAKEKMKQWDVQINTYLADTMMLLDEELQRAKEKKREYVKM